MRSSAPGVGVDGEPVVTGAEINAGTGYTFGGSRIVSAPAVSGSIDGDGVIAVASINGGIEGTKSADIALTGGIGVDEEPVVASTEINGAVFRAVGGVVAALGLESSGIQADVVIA